MTTNPLEAEISALAAERATLVAKLASIDRAIRETRAANAQAPASAWDVLFTKINSLRLFNEVPDLSDFEATRLAVMTKLERTGDLPDLDNEAALKATVRKYLRDQCPSFVNLRQAINESIGPVEGEPLQRRLHAIAYKAVERVYPWLQADEPLTLREDDLADIREECARAKAAALAKQLAASKEVKAAASPAVSPAMPSLAVKTEMPAPAPTPARRASLLSRVWGALAGGPRVGVQSNVQA